MAAAANVKSLQQFVSEFKATEFDGVQKKNLGEASLAPLFENRLTDLVSQLDKALAVVPRMNDGSVRQLMSALKSGLQQLSNIRNTDAAQFIQNRG